MATIVGDKLKLSNYSYLLSRDGTEFISAFQVAGNRTRQEKLIDAVDIDWRPFRFKNFAYVSTPGKATYTYFTEAGDLFDTERLIDWISYSYSMGYNLDFYGYTFHSDQHNIYNRPNIISNIGWVDKDSRIIGYTYWPAVGSIYNIHGLSKDNCDRIYENHVGEIFNDYANNVALGNYSHAEGKVTRASKEASHAEGSLTKAEGQYSHAEGFNSYSNGEAAHSEGSNNIAQGNYSHAEGGGTLAEGIGAHSEGVKTNAVGNYSHAEGIGGIKEIKVKDLTTNKEEVLFNFPTEQPLLAIGDASHVEGVSSQALQLGSHAEGILTYSYGLGSHSEGALTYAKAKYAHAEGLLSYAFGEVSHAEGASTQASGSYTHAEGNKTIAVGTYSHAEGLSTYVSGEASHAEGNSTKATGASSHAEGISSEANGDYSHAEGANTKANGNYSHAEGWQNTTSGQVSHIEGFSNTDENGSKYSHVEGDHNIVNNAESSHIEGSENTVIASKYSHVGGQKNNVTDIFHSLIIGYNNSGNQVNNSIVVGDSNITKNFNFSALFGKGNNINGEKSFVFGENNVVLASQVIELGNKITSKSTNSIGIGNNIIDNSSTNSVSIGQNITVGSSLSSDFSFGQNIENIGSKSFAIGSYVKTVDSDKFVIGKYNDIKTGYFFTLGDGDSSARHNAITVTDNGWTYVTALATYINNLVSYNQHIPIAYDANFVEVFSYRSIQRLGYSISDYSNSYSICTNSYILPTKQYVDKLLESKDVFRFAGVFEPTLTDISFAQTKDNHLVVGNWTTYVTYSYEGSDNIDVLDTSKGAVFRVSKRGWFGTYVVEGGDLILSYSDEATSYSDFNWAIIETHMNWVNNTGAYLLNENHGQRLLSNLHLTDSGILSYTYTYIYHSYTTGQDNDGFLSNIALVNEDNAIKVTYVHTYFRNIEDTGGSTDINLMDQESLRFAYNVNLDSTGQLHVSYYTLDNLRHHHNQKNNTSTSSAYYTYSTGENDLYYISNVNLDSNGWLSYTYSHIDNIREHHRFRTYDVPEFDVDKRENETLRVVTGVDLDKYGTLTYTAYDVSNILNHHHQIHTENYYDVNGLNIDDPNYNNEFFFVENFNITDDGRVSYTYSKVTNLRLHHFTVDMTYTVDKPKTDKTYTQTYNLFGSYHNDQRYHEYDNELGFISYVNLDEKGTLTYTSTYVKNLREHHENYNVETYSYYTINTDDHEKHITSVFSRIQ